MRFAKRIGYLSVVLVFAMACASGGEEGAEGAMESGMDDAATEEMTDSMSHDEMGHDSMMADSTQMMGDSATTDNPCAGN